ncbi:hypothetical protein B296_00000225 [Ensete ventricosum]|uniref:Uncharacterized protein n=1 Tax=Ensete ventricosum TaxID=4639 RepID=A0A427B0U3_ENSVE|nr:hypothetical protein B296_00000225 [Ensete ventricosum]
MYWCAHCSISGRVIGGRSISDQKNLDGLSPVKNVWMAMDGWRSGIPWTYDVNHPTNWERGSSLLGPSPGGRPWLVSGERLCVRAGVGVGKLHGLRRPEAVAPLRWAGFPRLGPLVTPFAGVPPGEPIDKPSNARAGAGPCALTRPRSTRCGVGARSDGWYPGVRLGKSTAGMVELRSG